MKNDREVMEEIEEQNERDACLGAPCETCPDFKVCLHDYFQE